MTSIRKIAGRMAPKSHDRQVELQDKRRAAQEKAGAAYYDQEYKRNDRTVQKAAEMEARRWAQKQQESHNFPRGSKPRITRIKVYHRPLGSLGVA